MNINHGIIEIKGESERFCGTFNEEGNVITGRWEHLRDDSGWQPSMEIKLVKTD